MNEHKSELAKYQTAIASLAARVQDVDIRAYEAMAPGQLASELRPIVSELLAQANALVSDVLQTYEAESAAADASLESERGPGPSSEELAAPYVPFELAIDAAIGAQSNRSLGVVGDIAFLAKLELRQRADRVARVVAGQSAVAIVGECDSALRRISKALTSIDVALARAGLVEPRLDFTSELEVSLRVRRACAKLRSRVVAGGPPTPETLHARLRAAGTSIAMLVGWEVYPSLRVRDRLHLRDLQRRMLDWLRSESDPALGLRVWQDLETFLRMLSQINRRQELIEHDTQLIVAATESVATCVEPSLPDVTMQLLAQLDGLDDDLDALLASPERGSPERWRTVFQRLSSYGTPTRGQE